MASTSEEVVLSIDEFLKYKQYNFKMTSEVDDYYKKNKHKFGSQNAYNKFNHKNKRYISSNDKIYSSFTSILNKLSNDNYQKLATEIKDLHITRLEQMDKLVYFIFSKAINENKFNDAYAKLTNSLIGLSITVDDKVIYFKNLMISNCQSLFNKIIGLTQSYEPKIHALGCVRFISNLYNCGFISGTILNVCLQTMLSRIIKEQYYLTEYLSILLITSGNIFSKTYPTELDNLVESLDKIIQNNKLSYKDKFTLMNIVEHHTDNKW